MYFGITVLSAGLIGGLFNIVVFLSLRTFRQSSCAIYLTIMSIVNIGQLLTGMLSRIMISGFNIDWTIESLPYCKARLLIFQFCTLISYTCLCLATIDQYFATCSRPRWQQLSSIKVARVLIIMTIVIWTIHAIPYAIFSNHVISSNGRIICTTTNPYFSNYRAYFIGLILIGFLPVIITVFFGILAYRNTQQLTHRTIPLVRRELDKQLTTMVLFQVLINTLTDIPFVIMNALTSNSAITNDDVIWAKLQFAFSLTLMLFYSYFAVSHETDRLGLFRHQN